MTHITKHNSNPAITKSTSCNLTPVEYDGSYKLSILRQHSLEVDSFVENGRQKSVHYVIKNSAFVLEVVLRKIDRNGSTKNPTDSELDFRKITLEASLLYDCEEDKPVMKVRSRPLTTRGQVSPTTPTACKLETTIEVLSSQHEDMNFKIKLFAVDSGTGKRLEHIAPVYSAPIQVISKPEVLVKKRQRSKKAPRKQTKQDQILEILSRMEAKQVSQQSQIDNLIANQNQMGHVTSRPTPTFHDTKNFNYSVHSPGIHSSVGSKRPFSSISNQNHDQVPSLESAYFQFLSAYNHVKRHERPTKLRKLFANTAPSDLSNFVEAAALLQSQPYFQPQTTQTPSISEDFDFSAISDTTNLEQLFEDLS